MKKQFTSYLPLFILIMLCVASCDKKDQDLAPDPLNVPLKITSVSPGGAVAGEKVIILGAGFSSEVADNVIKFGDVTAVTDSATSTRLVTRVPVGAKTGKVSVSVNGKTVAATNDFTILTNPPVLGGGTTNTSTGITENSATVISSITSMGDGTITQHGHVWSKSNNPPTIADLHTELGALPSGAVFPFKVNATLKNLESNTTYFVRMYATVGTITVYGEVFQIKTTGSSSATLSFTTQEQDILGITGSTIDIRTFAFAPEGTKMLLYGHVYSSTESLPTVANDRTLFTNGTIGKDLFSFTSKITGLKSKTLYYVRPYAVIGGTTHYGSGWKVTTADQNVDILTVTKKGDFPGTVGNSPTSSFVRDGKIYVADSKYTQTGYKFNYKFYEYNPATGAWGAGFDYDSGPLLSAGVSAYYNKKWYYIGSSTLSEYDFDTKKIVDKEITTSGFSGSSGIFFTQINEKVYLTKNSSLWELNLSTKVVAKLNTLPIQSDLEGLEYLNGKLYLMGNGGNVNESINALYEYNITSNTWLQKANATALNALKYKTYRFRYIKAIGTKLYGFNIWGIGEYDPASNTWRKAYISDKGEDALEGNVRHVIGEKAYIGVDPLAKYMLEIGSK
jgi:hypothetical protein